MGTENTIEDEFIDNLLKENCTLKALALNLSDEIIPPIKIIEVNTPLKALKTGPSHTNLQHYFLSISKDYTV